MRLIDHFITNFTAGELSPNMYGRIDVDRYYNGCEKLQNFIVLPQGGVTRRPGMEYLDLVGLTGLKTYTNGKARLIPFIFSSEQNYMLLFGDKYMIPYTNGGAVIHTTASTPEWQSDVEYSKGDYVHTTEGYIYRCLQDHTSSSSNAPEDPYNDYWERAISYYIETPYSADDLDKLKYAQSADVIYFVHPDYPPMKLTRTWDETYSYYKFAFSEMEFKKGPFMDPCTDCDYIIISGSTGDIGETVTVTAADSIFSSTDVGRWIKVRYTVEAETVSSGVHSGDGTQWSSDSWEVDGDWEFRASFANSPSGDIWYLQFSIDGGTTWRNYYAIDDRINTTIEGSASAEDLGAQSGILPQFRIYTEDAKSEITWNFRVKKSTRIGYIKITGYTSGTEVTGELQSTLKWLNQKTYSFALGAWSYTTGFPASITFHDGRLWFGGNKTYPNRVWASKSDDYENFEETDESDGALSLQPTASEVNTVIWMASKGNMLVGTAGDEWVFDGANVSPDDPPKARRETNFGSQDTQAVVANGYAVFVQYGGKKVRHIEYDWASDTYYAFDLTVMSDHIAGSGVKRLAYLKSPWSTIWVTRNDGKLLGLTYVPEQKVYAWHVHDTQDGEIEDVAAIPGELWVIVNRKLPSGSYYRFIERITEWDGDLNNAIFLDHAITIEDPAAWTDNRLYIDWQLAVAPLQMTDDWDGAKLDVYADGKYRGLFTLHYDGGSQKYYLDLPEQYTKVTIGLPYDSILKPMNFEHTAAPDTTQGLHRRLIHAVPRLVNTVGGFVGHNEEDVYRIRYPKKEGRPNVVSPEPFTGDADRIALNAPFGFGQYVVLKQDEPYPMTISSIIVRLEMAQ